MNNAIKIALKKAEGDYDLAASKLFGAPVLPLGMAEQFSEDIIFFGQIRLADIAALDTDNRLPHTGYLYLFLDTEVYPYTAWAEYRDEEPIEVIEDFNELDPAFAHLNQAYLMSFTQGDEASDGSRLFGIPSSDYDNDTPLCLQFDPLETATGFLEDIDGYAYFFFGEGETREEQIDGMYFVIDRS